MQNAPLRPAGEAMPAPQPDPMVDAIDAVRLGFQLFDVGASGLLETEHDALAQITYLPPLTRLMESPPVPTSERGAVEALRFLMDDQREVGPTDKLTLAVFGAVLAYFEGTGR